jgi:hypothetical protein
VGDGLAHALVGEELLAGLTRGIELQIGNAQVLAELTGSGSGGVLRLDDPRFGRTMQGGAGLPAVRNTNGS